MKKNLPVILSSKTLEAEKKLPLRQRLIEALCFGDLKLAAVRIRKILEEEGASEEQIKAVLNAPASQIASLISGEEKTWKIENASLKKLKN